MGSFRWDRHTTLTTTALLVVAIALLLPIPPALSVASSRAAAKGWELENNQPPSYAVIEPVRSNVSVDSVMLACGELHGHHGLQLKLYLSSAGPLLPEGAARDQLNKVPSAEMVIDGRTFAANIFFAGDFLIVAEQAADSTMASDQLLDAMERGQTMTIRFDLLIDDAESGSEFEGELVLDLRAGLGGAAVAAVRRCTRADQLWSRR